MSDRQKRLLSVCLSLGHTGGNDNPVAQAGTQLVVWIITTDSGYADNPTVTNAILDGYCQNADVRAYAKQLLQDCIDFFKVPSFTVDVLSGAITPIHTMKYNASTKQYEFTLTDTNGVLANYNYNIPGITFTKNGNTLKAATSTTISISKLAETTNSTAKFQNKAQICYMARSGYQEMSYRCTDVKDPVGSRFALKTEAPGSIKVIKNGETADGGTKKLEGVEFTVYDTEGKFVTSGRTNADGEVVFENLAPTKYTVKETGAIKGYVMDATPQKAEVSSGKTTTLTFSNELTDVVLHKSDVPTGEAIPGATIEIYDEAGEPVFEGVTDDEGNLEIKGLGVGEYTFRETCAPNQYTINEATFTFVIKQRRKPPDFSHGDIRRFSRFC